jgi:phosphatidylinositol alpha-1,6-mannosyltransferase
VIPNRFIRFCLVGAVAVGLNLILFAVLVGLLGIDYLWATVAIFLLGNAYGFVANGRWVFHVADHRARRLLQYYATMGVSLALNLSSMAVLVGWLKLNYLVASVMTSAWLAPVLYLAHGRVAFASGRGRAGKPRLLLVTHYYAEHGGGVEIVAGRLAALLGGSFDIDWRAAGEAGGLAVSAARSGFNGEVVRRPIRCWNGMERRFGLPIPLPAPRAVMDIARAARAADLVWVHDLIYPANLIAVGVAVVAGRPFVVTIHVGAIPYRSGLARRVMAATLAVSGRLLLTRASAVVFVSERVRAEFLNRWHLRRELLIPNGFDLDTFKPLTRPERIVVRRSLGIGDERVVLFVGRFVERKGLRLLHHLAAEMDSVVWLFAGHGPLDPETWGLANVRVEHGRSGRSLAALYGAADLLVLPSVGEGFPLVVPEALAMGLAVLVDPSTIAGYAAVAAVAEGEPVAGTDAIVRWSDHISEILGAASGPGAASRRVEFARTNWDWDRAAVSYARLITDVLGNSVGGPRPEAR